MKISTISWRWPPAKGGFATGGSSSSSSNSSPRGAWLPAEGGAPVGYVTAIKYGVSGWIGNLIVSGSMPGQGGREHSHGKGIAGSGRCGGETVWLTASNWESRFTKSSALRWWMSSTAGRGRVHGAAQAGGSRSPVTKSWPWTTPAGGTGEMRLSMPLFDEAACSAADGAFLISQPCGDGIQLGPWGGDSVCAARLLDEVLLEAGKGAQDLP